MPVSTKVQVRRDTAANWTTANATLASGEIGFETDTLKFKIGNGSTAWTSLKYSTDVSLLNGTITSATFAGLISDETGSGNVVFSTSPALTTPNIGAATGTSLNVSGQLISTQTTGTAPFTVSSTTQVANLNVATSGSVNATVTGTNSANLVYGSMADNDQFRIRIGGTATNEGFVEIATADDGTEPIHVRQYTGVFTSLARTATILDGSGNTSFPGTVSGTRFISNVSTGTAPFTVSSNTVVTNLNADLLDGFNTATAATANTVALRDANANLTANVLNAVRFISNVSTGTAPFTVSSTTQVANLNAATTSISVNIGAGAAGSLPYQSAANTTTFLARTATNNSTLAFNSSTNAPFWVQPTLSNTYYAATTSAQLAGVISDETGSGALVFGTTPTITPANAVAATSATQAGYIGMPQNSQSGAYTLVAGDAGKHIYYTVTGQTVTIPNNTSVAFQIGTAVTFITANSVSLSIGITTDTLRLANSTSTGTRTLAANGVATAIKITSNVWIISGNGLT
jgi:hypothetical protein